MTQDYESLRIRYNSLVEAINELKAENDKLKADIKYLSEVNENLEKALNINKGIMHHTITTDNELKQAYIQEINELKEELKASK